MCASAEVKRPGSFYVRHLGTVFSFLLSCLHQILVLPFQDPKPEDGGAYKCNASNDNGESNANITLNFSGKLLQSLW